MCKLNKRNLVVFIIMMLLMIMPLNIKANQAEGNSGDCRWYITDEWELVIKPQGTADECTLADYDNTRPYTDIPWHSNITKIESINITEGKVHANVNARGLFYNIRTDGIINLSNFYTNGTKDMVGLFEYTKASKIIFGAGIDTTGADNMLRMFQGASYKQVVIEGSKFRFRINKGVGAGMFGRGTWRKESTGELLSLVDLAKRSDSGSIAGTYTKISDVSNALNIDYDVSLKVGKIDTTNVISDLSVTGASNSNFQLVENNIVIAKVPITTTKQDKVLDGEVSFKLKNMVSDANGNTYDLLYTIKNITLYDLKSSTGSNLDGIVTLYFGDRLAAMIYQSMDKFNEGTGHNADDAKLMSGMSEDITIKVVNSQGTPVSGNYIFSVYDLDIPHADDKNSGHTTPSGNSGYGEKSEGITLVSGFDYNTTLRTAQVNGTSMTLLYNPSGKRWTGTAIDGASELSELAVRANAGSSGINFIWTGPVAAETRFFTNYQPKTVEIVKTDNNGNNINGAHFKLYKGTDLTDANLVRTINMDNTSSVNIWLAPGQYTLKETQAPTGYTAASDIVFFVDADNKLTINGQEVARIVVKNTANQPTYKVNYIYDDGSENGVLLPPFNVGGSAAVGTEIKWSQFKIDIDGYIYDNRDERDITIQADSTKNVINLYYIKKGTVVAKYLDKDTGEEIATREISEDKIGEAYETEQKEIDNYTFVEDTGNTTGVYSEETIEVIYYYSKVVPVPNTGLHATYQIIAGIALIAISLFGIKSKKKQHR